MKITVFIDVQNDFVDRNLGVDKDHVVANRILEYAKTCKENGVLTIATMDTHDSDTYHKTLEGKKLTTYHCVRGTKGYLLIDNLDMYVDKVLNKQTFMCKDLGEFLGDIVPNCKVDEIELCGFCASICVVSNALYLRGLFPDVKISVIENLCGDLDDDSFRSALTVMKNCQIDVKLA